MEIPFKLILDIINKNLREIEIFLEKNLKFRLRDKNGALVAIFILNLSKINSAIKKEVAN